FWSRRREAYPDFVRTFGMPVYVNGQARGSLDPDDPHWFLQTRKEALRRADVVVIFGTPLDFRIGYGRASHINPEAKLIHVDLEGRELGKNRGCDVGIIGDTGLVMEALTDCARAARWSPELSRGWLSELRALEQQKWEALRPQLTADDVTINPLRVCAEVDRLITTDTIIVADGGDFVGAAANVLRPRGFGHWLDAGPLGTLGAGPGYAMAAKLARPKSDVIVMYGDGAFGLNMMEFEACVRQKINIVGVIGNDAAWTQILRGQVQMYGPDRAPATRLAYTRYDTMVETLAAAVREFHTSFDVVFTSGGVGPTHDDVTMEGVARGLGRRVVRHPAIEGRLREYLKDKVNAARLKMAEVPEGSELIVDARLGFPTVQCENVYILPGIPEILEQKFAALRERFAAAPYFLRVVYTRERVCRGAGARCLPRHGDAGARRLSRGCGLGHAHRAHERRLHARQDHVRGARRPHRRLRVRAHRRRPEDGGDGVGDVDGRHLRRDPAHAAGQGRDHLRGYTRW